VSDSYHLGIIGGGNMGLAIARGAVRARMLAPSSVFVADVHAQRRALFEDLGCLFTDDPADLHGVPRLVLAVKPHQASAVFERLTPLRAPTEVLSVMAGVTSKSIGAALGPHARVIRVMPNTPCLLGEGMSAVAPGEGSRPGDESFALHLFGSIGRTVLVEESMIDAVTAVSGSGPAYIYLLAELMEEAARRAGLGAADARQLVIQTIIGAGRLLRESGADPATLRRQVTTPGGTTAAAIEYLDSREVPEAIVQAILAARDRSAALAAETRR